MPRLIPRIRSTLAGIVRPTGHSLVHAIFGGAHADRDAQAVDHGAATKPGTRTDRLRPQRHDLSAALRADPTAPEHELTTWPPAAAEADPCRAC